MWVSDPLAAGGYTKMPTNTSVKGKGVQLLNGLLPKHIFTCKDRIKSKFAVRCCLLNYSPAPVSRVFPLL